MISDIQIQMIIKIGTVKLNIQRLKTSHRTQILTLNTYLLPSPNQI